MSKKRFFWIDLEMTGLSPTQDRILEAAVVITDKEFNPLYEFSTAVFQPPSVLVGMNEWCQVNHRESGLIEEVPDGITEVELDEKLCAIAQEHLRRNKKEVVLCGNSIAHDRKFIEQYLPRFAAILHYRMMDVSSWKLIFRELYQREYIKENKHQALADIKESIAELKYYVQAIDVDRLVKPEAKSESIG